MECYDGKMKLEQNINYWIVFIILNNNLLDRYIITCMVLKENVCNCDFSRNVRFLEYPCTKQPHVWLHRLQLSAISCNIKKHDETTTATAI